MFDFGVFDSILDSVFVVDKTTKVIHCNEAAATLCNTSVRRIVSKATLSDLIEFAEFGLPMTESSPGFQSPSAYLETSYRLKKTEKVGKVQLAIYPIGENWVFIAHDVTLEEALHSKYRSELSQKEGYIADLEDARKKLEEYAQNLERLVEQRTVELRRTNDSLNAVLNSLGQGFLTFDSAGQSGSVYTRACLDILETNPQNRAVTDILRTPEDKRAEFQLWIKALFSEALPFDDLKTLGPSFFKHSKGRYVTVEYFPIREENKLTNVVMVATDRSAEHQAQIELENERQHASMIIKYVKTKEQFLQFLQAAQRLIGKSKVLASGDFGHDKITESFRLLHTLEGEAGAFSIQPLRLEARRCQENLHAYRHADKTMPPEVIANYRAHIEELQMCYDRFLDENKELIQLPKGGVERYVELEARKLNDFAGWMSGNGVKSAVVRAFQDRFMKERVERRFSHFDGLVQTVAEKLGKRVKSLTMVGGEIAIFPEPYAGLFESLVHVFRNAVDHGIETPDERAMLGKPEEGTIDIKFEDLERSFRLTVSDDGQGIDPEVIRAKMAKTLPEVNLTGQSDPEVIQNIFRPGFSSKESIGEFSGRGVGMDAVRAEVVKLGGSVKVYSDAGKGTKIVLEFLKATDEFEHARSA